MSTLRNTTVGPSRRRRIARVVTAIGIAALGGGLAACSDAPMSPAVDAPAVAPSLSRNGNGNGNGNSNGGGGGNNGLGLGAGYNVPFASAVEAQGLKRGTALAHPLVATFTVGQGGGHMKLPGTGLTITIPPNAVDRSTTIIVRALGGDLLAYDFQPHGLTFRKPLRLTQDLRGTNWRARGAAPTIDVGYFPTPADVNVRAGTASVKELLQGHLDARGQHLSFDVHHFSGYIVAWGFSDEF